jgi:hypothetical protein
MEKSLLILSGLPRGGESTWKTMSKFVLDSIGSDLAICYGSNLEIPRYLEESCTYKWEIDEPEDWKEYFYKNYPENSVNYLELGRETGLENSGLIGFAIKDIIMKKYINTLLKYDQIIYSRYDLYHVDHHPVLDNNFIWIAEGEDYGGVNDRHFIFPSKDAQEILDVCSYINNENSIKELPDLINTESVWYKHLESKKLDTKIKRYKKHYFTVSAPGDSTRWRVAEYKLYFSNNLKLKYPNEFISSIKYLKESRKSKIPLMLLYNYKILEYRKNYSKYIPRIIREFIKNRID